MVELVPTAFPRSCCSSRPRIYIMFTLGMFEDFNGEGIVPSSPDFNKRKRKVFKGNYLYFYLLLNLRSTRSNGPFIAPSFPVLIFYIMISIPILKGFDGEDKEKSPAVVVRKKIRDEQSKYLNFFFNLNLPLILYFFF